MTDAHPKSGGGDSDWRTVSYGPTVRVYNKRNGDAPPEAVYVGRPTKWGNPYVIGRDGTREEVIRKFREYAVDALYQDLHELEGKDLVCWCPPLPCHADVLLELANG